MTIVTIKAWPEMLLFQANDTSAWGTSNEYSEIYVFYNGFPLILIILYCRDALKNVSRPIFFSLCSWGQVGDFPKITILICDDLTFNYAH
jgi:hypothetical protein